MLVILSEAKDLASFPRGLPLTKDTRSFPSSLALLEGRPFVAGAPRGQALRRWRSSRTGASLRMTQRELSDLERQPMRDDHRPGRPRLAGHGRTVAIARRRDHLQARATPVRWRTASS